MSKEDKIKITNFEKLSKIQIMKMLDKMYKYEIDPFRTVGATELTRDAGRTDERTDEVKPIYPQQLRIIKTNASEDIACEMVAILSRGRWVKTIINDEKISPR